MLLPGVLSRTRARRWWPLRLAVVEIVAKSSPRSISPLAPTSVPKARCLFAWCNSVAKDSENVQTERTACCAHLAAEVRTQRRPGSCVLSASGFASLSCPASRRQGVSRSVDSTSSGCVIRGGECSGLLLKCHADCDLAPCKVLCIRSASALNAHGSSPCRLVDAS